MGKKDTLWWRKANYRMVPSCESCKESQLQCGYMWCELHRTEVFDGRICDYYNGDVEFVVDKEVWIKVRKDGEPTKIIDMEKENGLAT